eukprot:m.410994 g.410994  ORF g.410994 m.410994 type:complete len:564 (+) comp20159_c0_seq43:245-1936(+)
MRAPLVTVAMVMVMVMVMLPGVARGTLVAPCACGQKRLAPSRPCLPCSPGYHQPTTGASDCIACPGNTSSGVGSCSCSAPPTCPCGQYLDKSTNACARCPAGFSQPLVGTIGLNSCQPCAAGSVASSEGSCDCAVCPPRTYASSPSLPCQGCGQAQDAGSTTCPDWSGSCHQGFHGKSLQWDQHVAALECFLPGEPVNALKKPDCSHNLDQATKIAVQQPNIIACWEDQYGEIQPFSGSIVYYTSVRLVWGTLLLSSGYDRDNNNDFTNVVAIINDLDIRGLSKATLRQITFPNLQYIGGDLKLNGGKVLFDEPITISMPRLSYVGGDVLIADWITLDSVDLASLGRASKIVVEDNPALVNLVMPLLETDNEVQIRRNKKLCLPEATMKEYFNQLGDARVEKNLICEGVRAQGTYSVQSHTRSTFGRAAEKAFLSDVLADIDAAIGPTQDNPFDVVVTGVAPDGFGIQVQVMAFAHDENPESYPSLATLGFEPANASSPCHPACSLGCFAPGKASCVLCTGGEVLHDGSCVRFALLGFTTITGFVNCVQRLVRPAMAARMFRV